MVPANASNGKIINDDLKVEDKKVWLTDGQKTFVKNTFLLIGVVFGVGLIATPYIWPAALPYAVDWIAGGVVVLAPLAIKFAIRQGISGIFSYLCVTPSIKWLFSNKKDDVQQLPVGQNKPENDVNKPENNSNNNNIVEKPVYKNLQDLLDAKENSSNDGKSFDTCFLGALDSLCGILDKKIFSDMIPNFIKVDPNKKYNIENVKEPILFAENNKGKQYVLIKVRSVSKEKISVIKEELITFRGHKNTGDWSISLFDNDLPFMVSRSPKKLDEEVETFFKDLFSVDKDGAIYNGKKWKLAF